MDGETGVLIRSSAKGVINPYDLFALAELMCFRSPFLAAYNG
jgi:hypothetical protein